MGNNAFEFPHDIFILVVFNVIDNVIIWHNLFVFITINRTYELGVVVYWPPVRAVLPNYEVVEFQPQSVTAPDLGYFVYWYVAIPVPPFRPSIHPTYIRGRIPIFPRPPTPPILLPHRIILPHGIPLSPSQYTAPKLTLPYPIYPPPSQHACRIPVASVHLLLPKISSNVTLN